MWRRHCPARGCCARCGGPVTSSPRVDAALVETNLGPFDEMEFKGAGTFGDCWRIRSNAADQVLKVLVVADAGRFDRELGALRRLASPYVMTVDQFGTFTGNGRPYRWFIGEYVDGGTAGDAIARGDWPPEDLVLSFCRGVLLGLNDLHEAAIVHRDIKPSNVGLRAGSWSTPVILDLGLARLIDDSSITAYPARVGTVPYMSPEQLRLERANPRSDIFAVGVLMYELFTQGRHPFVADGEQIETSVALRRMEAGPDHHDDVPDDVWPLVRQLLAFHAFDRPDADVAADLVSKVRSG